MTAVSDEQIHASAIRFLIDGGEMDAANVLLSCSLHTIWYNTDQMFGIEYWNFWLKGPRELYEILNNESDSIRRSIETAIKAVLPLDIQMHNLIASGELIDIDPNWKSELIEIVRGTGVSNQIAGQRDSRIRTWNNLNFRSLSEIKIAKELDRVGVLFLPNCKARLGIDGTRQNREADFLICNKGKWGILEVDGEPFHPASRTVDDHERDRLFKAHGITVAEHYDAQKCYNQPEAVISEFLRILDQS